MPRAKGVIRIDSDSTHGWQVRVYRHGKTYSKLFSDRKCGSKEKAFKQAKDYRKELEEEVNAMPESEPKRRLITHNKNNATGVLGVSRTFKRDRHGHRHEVYAVSWNPAPGEARGTSYSIQKYGEETAFKMACRLRYQKMKEIYGDRYPLSSYLELFEQGKDHLGKSDSKAKGKAKPKGRKKAKA